MHPIAFDTETELITAGAQAPRMVCLSLADAETAALAHHTESREWIEAMLEGDRVLVGHNVAFDLAVVARKFPDLMPAIFAKYQRDEITDTMIRQKLIDIASSRRFRSGYALDDLARRWFKVDMEKDGWRLRYGELYDVPLAWWPDGAKVYALDDARMTLAIFREQEARAKYLRDQFRQSRAAWWLQLMKVWGITTDPVAVEALARRLQRRYDEVEALLIDVGLVRRNGTRDTKAAAQRMIEVCRAQRLAVVVTPTGQPKLDRDTCESTGDEVLEAYAEISGLKKKLGTDVELLRRGLIQANFNTLLETGRTSSSPNIQNLPRKGGVRECFVPRAGMVFAAADYSQFELRTVSQAITTTLGIRSRLAEALNRGFDPHLEIARRIKRCTYEQAVERLAAGDAEIDTARQVGKVANFGFPGGLGVRSFTLYARKAYGVTLTENEARALKQYWIESWPEFRAYFDWIGRQCESGRGEIRQVFVERTRGGCSFTEACNTLFQGLAADAAKHSGFLIARACYAEPRSPLYGCRPVNFVHDEFIVEVPDDEHASDAAEELARLMVDGASKFLPDVPPIAEPYLMRRWSKNAKPIRDDEGRLVPWNT